MKIVIAQAAQTELVEACSWYDGQQAGLGDRFHAEVDATVLRIARYPLLHGDLGGGFRRALVKTFPYMVIYAIHPDEDTVEILAIGHQHRRPGYWMA